MTRRLFTDATIWTGDKCEPRAAWLLVENGVISGIGGPGEPWPSADVHVRASGRPGATSFRGSSTCTPT